MRRSINILQDLEQIHTIQDLTEVFESIASLRIAKIRDRVVASKDFFDELWQTYTELRIDPKERLNIEGRAKKDRTVLLAVTAEGKLSGGIDESIIESLKKARESQPKTDVMVIGAHGLGLAQQQKIKVNQSFSLPPSDVNFSVSNIIDALANYKQISVFYQTYESLRLQKVAHIELIGAVRDLSEGLAEGAEIISSQDYIFEPGLEEIADYMESFMMGVALIQIIMESKLAQYASRFNTMSAAKDRAHTLADDYSMQYYKARRSESDDRLKETIAATVQQRTSGGKQG